MANTLTKQKLKLAKDIFNYYHINTRAHHINTRTYNSKTDILITVNYYSRDNLMTNHDAWLNPDVLPMPISEYNTSTKESNSFISTLTVLELMSQSLSDLSHIKLYIDT